MTKGVYGKSDARKLNALARLVDENGVLYVARLFVEVLRTRVKDPDESTIGRALAYRIGLILDTTWPNQ